MKGKCFLLVLCLLCAAHAAAQRLTLQGRVSDERSRQPVEYASVMLKDQGLWAVTDGSGRFTVKNVPAGRAVLIVRCLGYAARTLEVDVQDGMAPLSVQLKPSDLRLDEVTVTAHRKHDEATTSYTIDRAALDQQQLLNVADIATLLPGGKTVNPTLMSDNRLALRSGSGEQGNASFGTAIDIDGMRLNNNAAMGETMGASTRTVSTSDIERVEIVTGIPSVEYGDLSNGVVKLTTRRGKSPFIVEGSLNQHTRQVAVSKGFDLGRRAGVLNASVEHARSFGDAASPHTAYQRNILSLSYTNTFCCQSAPLTLNIGLTGNVGGYNSESDPDELLDDYARVRDNALRTHLQLGWLLNRPWITNAELSASLQLSDRLSENYSHASSASTQPCLHATGEGYFMADLSPTGYWYVRRYHDAKPLSWSTKLKADWTRRFGTALSRLMAGAEYTGQRTGGRGTYYEDLRYAPTWREYRYDRLPTMHNVALYAEEKMSVNTTDVSQLELTAGLRHDLTLVSGSVYGTVGSLSPRLNSRYLFWQGRRDRWVSDLSLHAGWGKSVKLPSFQVLYPAPSYADRLAFASTTTASGQSFYAYHTLPTKPFYNNDLRWQYTNQADIGVELSAGGTRISLSAFYHRTHRSYTSANAFSPMSYLYTPPSALDALSIDAQNRTYAIDRQTGLVSVADATGRQPTQELSGTVRHTYALNSYYTNASPVSRYGVEWVVDFARLRSLCTTLRLDGNYYHYKNLDDLLFADIPMGTDATETSGRLYSYVGYYRGSSVGGAGSAAVASLSNGSLSRQLNLNATVTTHIPRLRLIVALRVETTLYSCRRQLSQYADGGPRGYALNSAADYFGTPYDSRDEDLYVAVYPEYYATWDRPAELLPFAERFAWARDNDPALFSDLSQLVVRSNYAYVLNANRTSSYYSANLSVTKEIGDHVSLSFYANNFLNNMHQVRQSQTGLKTSLFGSSYIPDYYYGLSLRLKL